MKALFISMAVIFFLNILYAEPKDSIFVVISADTVYIWNTGAYENCGCLIRMDVSLSNDTIYVTEVDTSSDWALCYCNFDLCTSITGLQSGDYIVMVYRKMSLFYPDTLFYIGSTQFTYGGSTLMFISQSYQSDCYNITEVKESEKYREEFKLEQNYPNPFNPNTKISWQSSISGWQTIKVYDVLGREVETLVNEEKVAGTYDLTWNVANLPGGVYFYRLQVGSFNQTKKLVVLK